jgi:hypothetical protein
MRILNGVGIPLPDHTSMMTAGIVIGPEGEDDKFVMIVIGRDHLAALHTIVEVSHEQMHGVAAGHLAKLLGTRDNAVFRNLRARVEGLHKMLSSLMVGWVNDGADAQYQLDVTADVTHVHVVNDVTQMPHVRREDLN